MSMKAILHEMERLLVRLHELIASEQTDSEAAEEIRSRMDELSGSLSPSQLRVLHDLSGDLYMLTGEEVVGGSMREMSTEAVRAAIAAAFSQQRWSELLDALRAPHQLPRDRVAYVRARAWSSSGFHLSALKFFEYAYSLVPNPNYMALALDEYMAADMADGAETLVRDIEGNPGAHPTLVLKAALVLLGLSRNLRDEERVKVDERIGCLIERAKGDYRWTESVPSLRAAGLVTWAFGLARAERYTEAESALDTAIGVSPSSDVAWVARGLVRLDAGRAAPAHEDFLQAVHLGTRTPWPYFFLTYRAVTTGDFQTAATLGLVGAGLTSPSPMRAKLYEWRAIALAELGHAPASVLAAFDAAEADDPFDAVIQANAAKYRSHVTGLGASAMWQPSAAPQTGSLLLQYSREAKPHSLVGQPVAAAA